MISQRENELLTSVLPQTAGGHLLRQYWQPAALVDELNTERPLIPLTLLGEALILFKTPEGDYRAMERHCPHRGVDLAFGRLEQTGVRCPFHGWLFDGAGRCLEQPAEPPESPMCRNLRTTAYPCQERSGVIWIYMGKGETPPLPDLDCFLAPDSYTFAFKGLWDCNWLQALEVGIDPVHASFLHRFFEDDAVEESYGKQFRDAAADSDAPLTQILREYSRPAINVEPTSFGLRLETVRKLDEQRTHYRITNLLFPNAITIPMSNEMIITQWHVPVDNHRTYWYAVFTSFKKPVDRQLMREQRLEMHDLPNYAPKVGRHNDWGYNPEEQATSTYTGMGQDINVHDQWAVESQGRIQDRTREHLAKSDIAITANRRLMKRCFKLMEEGQLAELPGFPVSAKGGPVAIDAIVGGPSGDESWRERDMQRRDAAPWEAPLQADSVGVVEQTS